MDDIRWGKDGGLLIRFTAVGIDNENATYRYALRLTKQDTEALLSARYIHPLIEKIEELKEELRLAKIYPNRR